MAQKFPRLIHVTVEGDKSEEWLQVHKDGVMGVEEHGTQIAIYKLVEVGVVQIQKSFQKPARKRR